MALLGRHANTNIVPDPNVVRLHTPFFHKVIDSVVEYIEQEDRIWFFTDIIEGLTTAAVAGLEKGRSALFKAKLLDISFGIMNKSGEIFKTIFGEKPRMIFYPNVIFKYACALVNRPLIFALRNHPNFTFSKSPEDFSR